MAVLAIALIPGACAGSSHVVAPQIGPQAAIVSTRLLYVADSVNDSSSTIRVYPADQTNPKPLLTISEGIHLPQGLAVDSLGTLYVANTSANNVTEYLQGATGPFKTISTGLQDPAGVVVDANGTIYVGNRNLSAHEAFIQEYAHGSRSPTATIVFPKEDLPQIGGIAVDKALNLYVEFSFNNGPSTVTKFAPGSTHGNNLALNGLGQHAGAIGVDASGNLYVAVSSGAIAVFAPHAANATRLIASGLVAPSFFTVDPSGALFVPNQNFSGFASDVLEFAPNARSAEFRIGGFNYPTGTAISP